MLYKKILLLLFFNLTMISISNLQAQEIKSIDITGLSVVSRGTILSYIPVEVGDNIYRNTSNNIIKSLYQTGLFADVSVINDDGVVSIHLLEKPHIFSIKFTGYSDNVIEEEQLTRILKSTHLTKGEIFKRKTLDALLTQLQSTYKDRGYYLAKITPQIDIDKKNRVNIVVDIEENDLVRVSNMSISGNKFYTKDDLLDKFNIGEASFFIINYFTEKDHYSKIELELGLKKIKTLYENNGFVDFAINAVKADLSADKKTIDIRIKVFEGKQYKIGKVKFSGDSLYYASKDIEKQLTFKTGDIFKQKSLVKTAQNIVNYYTKRGYAFIDVRPQTGQNSNRKTIDVDVFIKLDARVYINRILIQGNAVTKDEVIRREIIQSEGGLYSSEQVQDSIANLKRLGYFSNVNFRVEKIPNVHNRINLIFNVEETKTGNFTIGLSYSGQVESLALNASLAEKNFLGTGNTFVVNLNQSASAKQYSFSFINPHFNDQGDSVNYGMSFNEFDASKVDISNYQISSIAANAGYGVPLTKTSRFNINFSLSNHDITCSDNFILQEEEYILTQQLARQCSSTASQVDATYDSSGTIVNSTSTIVTDTGDKQLEPLLSFTWSDNTLNRFLNPSSGSKASIAANIALPFGDLQYIKLDAKQEIYNALSEHWILKFNYKVGIAKGYGGEALPFFRRYHSGSSVRGFGLNTLGERYNNGNSKGGEISFLTSVSAIHPVPFIKDSKNMRVGAFIDAVGLYDTTSDINFNDIRASVGVAFTWLTVIGPIGLSYGVPILKKSNDVEDNFNFNLGSTF